MYNFVHIYAIFFTIFFSNQEHVGKSISPLWGLPHSLCPSLNGNVMFFFTFILFSLFIYFFIENIDLSFMIDKKRFCAVATLIEVSLLAQILRF